MHLFDFKGNILWKNQLPDSKIIYAVPLVSENNIYILRKNYLKSEKSYFTVNQNKYLVINDRKDIFVFDIPNKSLVKKIPHKQGDVRVEVYKAKEGHIMLSEYNKDDGSTKLSIEAL